MTARQPSSQSELQLYRVLQRANLLQYYDTFISQGGDDVQQLCEAGEEEFLEIMALVGMASKPLHVRRLQKALQEWVTNPALFQRPLSTAIPTAAPPGSIAASVDKLSPGGGTHGVGSQSAGSHPLHTILSAGTWKPDILNVPSPGTSLDESRGNDSNQEDDRKNSPVPIPVLIPDQLTSIEIAAEKLVPTLPPFEVKPMNMKKEINREIDAIITLPFDAENRMDLVRKYSAIYGRFDSKRKTEKPMSLHEISVNEAAAQICKHIPELLSRRDELFPLARQVVRDSGYQYSKGHSSSSIGPPCISRAQSAANTPNKKQRLDTDYQDEEMERLRRETQLNAISQTLEQVSDIQEQIKAKLEEAKSNENYTLVDELQTQLEECSGHQLQLLEEQSELMKKQKQSLEKNITDEEAMEEENSNASSSPPTSTSDKQENGIVATPLRKNLHQKTNQFVKETLFDEGLRIAQQYGMEDFAEELLGLKPSVLEEKTNKAENGDDGGNKSCSDDDKTEIKIENESDKVAEKADADMNGE